MTPISRTLNTMAHKAQSIKKKGPRKVKANFGFASCKDLAIKQLKTLLHGFDVVSVVVFNTFLKENTCFKGSKVLAHLCASLLLYRKLWEEVCHMYLAQCSG